MALEDMLNNSPNNQNIPVPSPNAPVPTPNAPVSIPKHMMTKRNPNMLRMQIQQDAPDSAPLERKKYNTPKPKNRTPLVSDCYLILLCKITNDDPTVYILTDCAPPHFL